jgi:branched-chain amino acid transport system substrate-binding protein
MKQKTLLMGLLFLLVVGVALFALIVHPTGQAVSSMHLKIGSILPITEPSAIFGENLKNGMELARKDLAQQGILLEIVYEDSQANPSTGLNAYTKLRDIDQVQMIMSAYSRVSVPLVSLADKDKIPIMMTIVSAKGVSEKSDLAFRFFSNEKQYVEPHFVWVTKERYPKIALLTMNDEFGASVRDVILLQAAAKGMDVVADETYTPNAADFRSQLTKIKASGALAVVFVGSVPAEVSSVLKQFRELQLKADFIEASAALAQKAARDAAGDAAEDASTITYAFSLGISGQEFKQKYLQTYGKEPSYAAAFGYDMVNLVGRATKGKNLQGLELAQAIKKVKNYESLNGPTVIQQNGEINPPAYSVKVKNGELVLQ